MAGAWEARVDDAVIQSLTAAVQARPDDLPLRLHLATMLVDAGRGEEAVTHLAAVLARDPGSTQARALMARALDPGAGAPPPPAAGEASGSDAVDDGVDWAALSEDLSDVVPPMFVDDGAEAAQEPAHDVEHVGVRLSDVGGLQQVKDRLEVSFLAPMRNPELRSLYKTSLRGGLMLYGPPGCGKTFLARPWPVSWVPPSCTSRWPTSSTCTSARASATSRSCSPPLGTRRPACSSSTSWTRSAPSAP